MYVQDNHHGFFPLVILIVTKREAGFERAKTAKSGANHF